MRIESVTFGEFKNLSGVPIEFHGDETTSVVVGRNGTGKSNLLEGLAIIFRDLDLGRPSDLDFEIRYRCRGETVEVKSKNRRSSAFVDGERAKVTDIRDPESGLRPDFVFGYYSGPTNRFEKIFLAHERQFYAALLANEMPPLRRLFFARPHHSQFVLLAFATAQDEAIEEVLRSELRIDAIESVTFVLQEPPWAANSDPHDFWGARGTVRAFLEEVRDRSLPLTPISESIETRTRASRAVERAYLHLSSPNELVDLSGLYEDNRGFFSALESMTLSDLIHEVRVDVRVLDSSKPLEFRELSEGEQQLLVVLGLLQFTAQDEALYLLDEPDTHFNPAWSLRFTHLARRFLEPAVNSHLVMATHDPLVIADLTRDQVLLFERDDSGQVTVSSPIEDPRGQGIAGLLTSEIYGLRSQLDLTTLNLLDRKRLISTKKTLTKSERAELKDLNERLWNIDAASIVRDPFYSRWAEAYGREAAEENLLKPVLSGEELKRQEELALEILAQLEADRGEAQ